MIILRSKKGHHQRQTSVPEQDFSEITDIYSVYMSTKLPKDDVKMTSVIVSLSGSLISMLYLDGRLLPRRRSQLKHSVLQFHSSNRCFFF